MGSTNKEVDNLKAQLTSVVGKRDRLRTWLTQSLPKTTLEKHKSHYLFKPNVKPESSEMADENFSFPRQNKKFEAKIELSPREEYNC